jgi:hypothetical protein
MSNSAVDHYLAFRLNVPKKEKYFDSVPTKKGLEVYKICNLGIYIST